MFFCFCLSSPLPDQSRGLTETITDRQEERDRYGAAIADHTGAAQSLQKFLQRSSRQGQVLRVDTASCQRAQVQGELGEGERAEDVGEDGGEAGLGRIWPHRACSEVSERASERASGPIYNVYIHIHDKFTSHNRIFGAASHSTTAICLT